MPYELVPPGCLKRPVGRPRKAEAKRHKLSVRMSDELSYKLDSLVERTGKKKTEIMKEAIELYDLMVKTKGE